MAKKVKRIKKEKQKTSYNDNEYSKIKRRSKLKKKKLNKKEWN